MQSYSRLWMFTCLLMAGFDGMALAKDPPLDVKDVQRVRQACFIGCPDDETTKKRYRSLISMGEKLFPAYEVILSDPKSSNAEIGGVFIILCHVKADSRRFLKHAVSRLTDSRSGVRLCAVNLLGRIGSPAEASPTVALLSDEDTDVAYWAAKTLVAVGGSHEVVAMDVWLRGVSHRDDRQLREHVHKCRDELKKRLDAKKPPKK